MPYNRGMNSPDLDALDGSLVTLADLYAAKMGVSLWRVGHLAANRGSFFVDLKKKRRHCQTNTYLRVLGWFSAHWPQDVAWPADIPHPQPPRSGGGAFRNPPT